MWDTNDTLFERLQEKLPSIEDYVISIIEDNFLANYREVPEGVFTARYYAVVRYNIDFEDYDMNWDDDQNNLLVDLLEVFQDGGEVIAIFDNGKRLDFELKIVIKEDSSVDELD